jgi:hypothetical protein
LHRAHHEEHFQPLLRQQSTGFKVEVSSVLMVSSKFVAIRDSQERDLVLMINKSQETSGM